MKDFDRWNDKKKITNENFPVVGVHEREIWWVTLGLNVGIETDGKHSEFKRPVLVIKRFNTEMVWILPMTSQIKSSIFFEKFDLQDSSYYVSLSQIKTLSTRRFLRKVGMIQRDDFMRILKKVIAYFPIKNEDPLLSGSSRRPKP